MPDFYGPLHIALTVRDMHRSADWYSRVLGFQLVKEFKGQPDEPGSPRILLIHPSSGFLVGLCDHPDRSRDVFDYRRTGLDHLALAVAGERELNDWLNHLDALGVAHSPPRDIGHSMFVSFEDPDGVQLELWVTRVQHTAAQQ